MANPVGYRTAFYWSLKYWCTKYFATHPAEVSEIIESLIVRVALAMKMAEAGGVNTFPALSYAFRTAMAGIAAGFSTGSAFYMGPSAVVDYRPVQAEGAMAVGSVSADYGRASMELKKPKATMEIIQ